MGPIKGTQKYDTFRHLKENRILDETHVKRMMKKIEKKNLLKDFPILVDNEMRIYDGQYRLEACKRLKTTVYYAVTDSLDRDDIVSINTGVRPWRGSDILHRYVKLNNADYVAFESFMSKYNLSFTVAYVIMMNKFDSKHIRMKFNDGTFSYPFEDKLHHSIAREIVYLEKYYRDCRKNRPMAMLLLWLANKTECDFNRLNRKIEMWVDHGNKMKLMAKLPDNITHFNEVYNYREKQNGKMIYFKRPKGGN